MLTLVDRLFEAHVAVSDLDRSIAFYRDRLGFEVAHVTPAREAAFVWVGARGRTMLGLWTGESASQKTTSHLAFGTRVADVIAAPRVLAAAGIPALDFDGHTTAQAVVLAWMPAAAVYFRDPDGNLLEYIAMLSEPPRADAGVVTWNQWRGKS